MTYSDGLYAVEQFDWVEFKDVQTGWYEDGQIVRLFPRKHEADVRYEIADHNRARGARRNRTVRLPITDLELVRRDG